MLQPMFVSSRSNRRAEAWTGDVVAAAALHRLAFGFVTILPTLFLAKAFGVLRVDPSLLVAAGLIEHTPLLEAKGLNGLALDRICRDFTSGTVVHGPFRLSSRTGFLRSTVRGPFGSGGGVGLVGLPRTRCLASFLLSLGVDPFANAVELDRAFGWRRV